MEKKYSIVLRDGKPHCVSTRTPTKWSVQKVEELIKECIEWMTAEQDNIFVEEFLVKQGWYPSLITIKIKAFQKLKPVPDLTEIYRLYSIVKKIQEMKLLKGGLTKKYDATITKLTLSHHHEYRDRIDQGANSTYFFQQNVLNQDVQGKSAAELARRYQQIIRSLPGSQSIPLPGATEIPADIE